MSEKIKKIRKSQITVFYQGGTKLRADTTHTPEELQAIIDKAKKEVIDAKIDTVNEDESVVTDTLYLTRNALLFYSISVPMDVNKSDIVIAPAGSVPGTIK